MSNINSSLIDQNENNSLEKELLFLLNSIFKNKEYSIDPIKYCEAQKNVLNRNEITILQKSIGKIIDFNLDIESIEFAMRFKNKNNPLTKNIQILIFLVESEKDFFENFYNEKDSFLIGLIFLIYHTFRSLFLLLKGILLISWYKLD